MELIHTEAYKGGEIKVYTEPDWYTEIDCQSGVIEYKEEDDKEEERLRQRLDDGDYSAWFYAKAEYWHSGVKLAEYTENMIYSYDSFADFIAEYDGFGSLKEGVIEAAKTKLATLQAIKLED